MSDATWGLTFLICYPRLAFSVFVFAHCSHCCKPMHIKGCVSSQYWHLSGRVCCLLLSTGLASWVVCTESPVYLAPGLWRPASQLPGGSFDSTVVRALEPLSGIPEVVVKAPHSPLSMWVMVGFLGVFLVAFGWSQGVIAQACCADLCFPNPLLTNQALSGVLAANTWHYFQVSSLFSLAPVHVSWRERPGVSTRTGALILSAFVPSPSSVHCI